MLQHFTNTGVTLAMLNRDQEAADLFSYVIDTFPNEEKDVEGAKQMYLALLYRQASSSYTAGKFEFERTLSYYSSYGD